MKLERDAAGEKRPALGAVFGGVLLVGAGLSAVWLRLGLPVPFCIFHRLTGLPCPTCGSTRMVESILSGAPLQALAWNPLVFFVLVAVAVWAVLSVARWLLGLPAWRLVATSRERLALRLFAVAALLAGWAYLIWRELVSIPG